MEKRYNINPLHYPLAVITILIIILSAKSCRGQDTIHKWVIPQPDNMFQGTDPYMNTPATYKSPIDTIKVVFIYVNKYEDVGWQFGYMVEYYDNRLGVYTRKLYNKRWKSKHIRTVITWAKDDWK